MLLMLTATCMVPDIASRRGVALAADNDDDDAVASADGISRISGDDEPSASSPSEFVHVRDASLRVSLDVPSTWASQKKAGANLLYERPDLRSTSVGIVVLQRVSVSSLEDFGSLESVRDKVLRSEEAKDGFISLQLNEAVSSSREARDAEANADSSDASPSSTFYTIDYDVSTTRGDKRVISAVSIRNKSLYVLSIQAKPGKYTGEGDWQRETDVLRHIEQSFRVF